MTDLSIGAIRTSIQTKLESLIMIQDWDLDYPINRDVIVTYQGNDYRVPSNCAVYDPIADLIMVKNHVSTEIKATFRYYIAYRFDNRLSKHQLPIKDLENLQQYVLTSFIVQPSCDSKAVKLIEVANEEYPLRISRINGDDGDWIVTIIIPLYVTFNSYPSGQFPGIQPGDLEDGDTWQANRINLLIYKENQSTNLDRVYQLELNV